MFANAVSRRIRQNCFKTCFYIAIDSMQQEVPRSATE
jgi:hypothetical protein